MTTADPALRHVQRCPVGCEAPLVPTRIVLPEGALLRCAGCGQLLSQVTDADYRRSMAVFNRPDFNRPDARASARRLALARRRLARTARLVGKAPADMHVLDVGCSRGSFVADAIALGYRAEGVEPAPDIAAAARDAGLTVHTGLLEDQHFPDASFDALTLFEVIEHLREPAALLAECRRVLAPGGVLLVSTGNGAGWTARMMGPRWDYFQIEKDAGHVSFFNPGSIGRLAQRCGFAVARIETRNVRIVTKEEVPRPLYVLSKLVTGPLGLAARALGTGHDMLVYLRRAG